MKRYDSNQKVSPSAKSYKQEEKEDSTSLSENRIAGRWVLLSVLTLVFLLSLTGCRSGDDASTGLPDERDECGECLDMPTGEVCTAEGETIRNSCLAICRGKKIQCFQSCPCPKPDEKKEK